MTIRRYFGTKEFYQKVFTIAIPIMVQIGITTLVSLLDNIMIGQAGTLAVSAVTIAVQVTSVYTMLIFGVMTAAGIFSAQFFGKQDIEGARNCLRMKLVMYAVCEVMGILICLTFGKQILSLFIDENANSAADAANVLMHAWNYLCIILIGLVPYGLFQALSTSVKESGNTVLPMQASVAALVVNFIGNWILIFGNLGAPKLGVEGAAIATTLSRFVELLILMLGMHKHRAEMKFAQGLFQNFHIPSDLARKILIKGMPLIFNETLWSVGLGGVTQGFSMRGLDAVASYNIASTIQNLFCISYMGLGNAIGILIGQELGNGDTEKAVEDDRKMIMLSFLLSAGMGILLFFLSPYIPLLYKTGSEVQQLSSSLLKVQALLLPNMAIYNSCYFTIRSGGKTFITFLFDSGYTCLVSWPLSYCLSKYTVLPFFTIFVIVQCSEILKSLIGLILVHKRIWVQNLVQEA